MKKPRRDLIREDRIENEAIVDAGPEEPCESHTLNWPPKDGVDPA
jgi:hypothetical protein